MNIDNFCNLGAALQNKQIEVGKQPQIYFYRSNEDSIYEMLSKGYFNALNLRVAKDDLILLYSPRDERKVFAKVVSNSGGIVQIIEMSEDVFQHDEMPIPSIEYLNKIVQYIGNTTSEYTNGFFYRCIQRETYTGNVSFDRIISCSNEDFINFLESKFENIEQITHGTMTYASLGNIWRFVGKNSSDETIATYQQYTGDFEEEGFVFTGTYQDGDIVNFTCNITETISYEWENIIVQDSYLKSESDDIFVHKTGDETISGVKSFVDGIITPTINNGATLNVPNKTGTLATKDEVDLAANSGRMITNQGVWYAKMYSASEVPAANNGTTYADFSQVDAQGNPIIVIYNRVNNTWVQRETIIPPTEYDGYVAITSKIWDIPEQSGQQGGRILWNHQSKEFTPYPQIISFENANLTGTPTAPTPASTDNSTKISTTAFVKNLLGNYALLNSNNIFTSLNTVSLNDNRMGVLKNTIIDRNVTPLSNQHEYFDFQDKNGLRLCVIGGRLRTDGKYGAYIQAGNEGYIGIFSDGNSVETYAPTPATTDNSTQIATTAFVTTAISSINAIKPGTIMPFGGSSVPTGYLQCNGAAVSRTTYSALFSAIGTTWGAGDGSTTFNLPNFNNVYLPTSYSLTVAINGNGKTLGFTEGTSNGGLIVGKYMNGVNSAGGTVIHQLAYNTNVGTNTNLGTTGFYDGNVNNTAQNPLFNVVKTIGLTTDSTKSGLTGTTSISRMTTQKWIIKY